MTNDQKPIHELGNHASDLRLLVELLRHYSNSSDLLEQLRKAAVILSNDRRDGETDAGAEANTRRMIRSRRLRDRFFSDDLQAMIDLYTSGAPAQQVAEKFGISLRSVKRLLHQHGVHRARLRIPCAEQV
jgi:hypothetical protein